MGEHGIRYLGRIVGPDLKGNPGMLYFKGGSDLRKDIGAGDGAGPDNEFAGYRFTSRGYFLFQLLDILEDCQCPRVKDIRFQGGHDGPSQPIEQLTVQSQLKVPDVFADGRLAGVEQLGGLGEAPVFIDRDEYFQMSGFDGST